MQRLAQHISGQQSNLQMLGYEKHACISKRLIWKGTALKLQKEQQADLFYAPNTARQEAMLHACNSH